MFAAALSGVSVNNTVRLEVMDAGGGTPESSAAAIRKEQEQWRAFGKELNVEPQ